jgi:hypothetical protein
MFNELNECNPYVVFKHLIKEKVLSSHLSDFDENYVEIWMGVDYFGLHGKTLSGKDKDYGKYIKMLVYSYGYRVRDIWYRKSDMSIYCCRNRYRNEVVFTRKNGKRKRLITLDDTGRQHNDTIIYHKNGHLKRVLVFNHGHLVSRSEYDKGGYPYDTTNYKPICGGVGKPYITLEEGLVESHRWW